MSAEPVVRFRACGTPVDVQAEHADLREILRQLYPAYLDRGAPREVPCERLSFARRGTGYEVATAATGTRRQYATRDEAIDAVEFALTQAFLRTCGDLVHIHASGATVGDRAMLILGASGGGKSSLALFLAQRGLATFGDDVVFVGEEGVAVPFKRHFKIDPAILTAAGMDAGATPFWAPGATEAWFDPGQMAAGWAAPAPVDLVVVARFVSGAETELDPLSRAEGLQALLDSRLEPDVGMPECLDRLLDVVRGARVLAARFGSAEDAAARLVGELP